MQNIKLIELANRLFSDRSEQQRVVSLALAVILGTEAHLPSEKVEDVSAHYRAVHRITANRAISDVNESILVDIPFVQHLAESIYFARYRYAFDCGLDALLKPSTTLSGEDAELLTKYNQAVTLLSSEIARIVYK